jgi:type IV pilus assembly protein PilE
MRIRNGFTLIELMIVVVIVAILAAVAIPGYTSYVQRGKLTQALGNLGSMQLRMEQFYQDNRTYSGACTSSSVAPKPVDTADFAYSCPTLTGNAFVVRAEGRGGMQGFIYELNQQGTHTTVALPQGWATPTSPCWAIRKDGTC